MGTQLFFKSVVYLSFSIILLTTGTNAIAQRGHEKATSDNTFGNGGSKVTFLKKDFQFTLYRDPNNIRRLFQSTTVRKEGSDSVKTTAKMYYDNTGKKDYFDALTLDANDKPLREVRADFSNDNLLSGSAWELKGGLRVNYDLDLSIKKLLKTDGLIPDVQYTPDLTLGATKAIIAPKFKFAYVVSGGNHYLTTEKTDEYTGGTVTTEAYNAYDSYYEEPYNVEHKKLFDKNGVLRHELYREFYYDGCVYEEETYYDCHGMEQYYSEDWYDNYDGYSYEFYEAFYKQGKKTAGYYYYDDYYDGYREYYDPKTMEWVNEWTPDLNSPEDFQPDFDDCPDACRYWNHDFFAGFSLIREDDNNTGFYLYGLEATYTYNLSPRFGVTGDLSIDFRKENDTKLTKIIALIGANYWAKKACYSDPVIFSLHALAGISNVRYNYSSSFGNYKTSRSYFTVCAGLQLGYYFADRAGIGLRLDALPTFADNNTSINARATLGLMLRSRGEKYFKEVY